MRQDSETDIIVLNTALKYSDVVLETRVLVSRRLEDKMKVLVFVLVLDHEVLVLIEHLVLVSVLKKKSCSFSRLLL